MSGIAGILNLDGAPVDPELLERMAALLEYRGPDRTGIWRSGPIGFVHTLFHTTREAEREQQPMSLDGEIWITADARLDAREDLLSELRGRGCPCSPGSTDPELLVHAYAVWGEACLDHLLGDFAFGIWDNRDKKLFCARDHFGVRPFFYARAGETLIFSNAFDVPRLHPGVPDDLWEPAIGDFLVLGDGYDLERTAREAIRRLPPAHAMVVAGGQLRTRRYWSLPVDPPTLFRRSRDYVERFFELFEKAVADRLRTDRAAILMSGGMDSSSVAAMARHVVEKQGGRCRLSAHTQTYHHLIPYKEGRLAALAARKIGIPWSELPLDDKQLLGFWDQPEFRRAEPWMVPLFDWTLADALGKPPTVRVMLTGQGSDGIFSSLRSRHIRNRIRQGRWLLLGAEIGQHLLSTGRLRRLYLWGHLRARLTRRKEVVPPIPYPDWLNPDFERRLRLRERYERLSLPSWEGPSEAARPEAHGLMSAPIWPGLLEEYEIANVGACLEVRHPFFDLRLVRYVLSLAALPWCSDKELLRRSMAGMVPDEVRLGRKRPVVVDLLLAFHRSSRKPWLEHFEAVPQLAQFVDIERAVARVQDPGSWEVGLHLRPFSLNYWLKWEARYAYKLHSMKEECRAQTQ